MSMDFEQNDTINLEVRIPHEDGYLVSGFVTVVKDDNSYIPNLPFRMKVGEELHVGVEGYHRDDYLDFYLLIGKQDKSIFTYYLLNSKHITEEDENKGHLVLTEFDGDTEVFLNYVKRQVNFGENPQN
ncbi:hypothetical protein ACQUY5_29315 [Bacillus cereus]|uniref:hypothetical protein n=1 Tax=Bacillus cereus TaxID=1396 RepID=UPI003D1761C2